MAQKYQWDEETKLAKLVEALEDKALTFFSSLSEDVRNNYALVRKKMNSLFEPQEPPNTVRKQLQILHQEVDESMEEWAEHCQCFAYDAWGNISIDVAELAAVETFCMGALDSEAVLPVLENDPATLDDALEMLKRSVHNRRSVNTRSCRYQKTARIVSFTTDSLSAVDVHTAGVANTSPDPSGVIHKVESDIKDLKATMAQTQKQMSKLMELLNRVVRILQVPLGLAFTVMKRVILRVTVQNYALLRLLQAGETPPTNQETRKGWVGRPPTSPGKHWPEL